MSKPSVNIPFSDDQAEQARDLLGAASAVDQDPTVAVRVGRSGFRVTEEVFEEYSTILAGGPGEVESDEAKAEREAKEKADADAKAAEEKAAEEKAAEEKAAEEKAAEAKAAEAKKATAKKTTATKAADKKSSADDVLGDPKEN